MASSTSCENICYSLPVVIADLFLTATRLSSFACNSLSFALESCRRLHIRLHNIILSYGLGQDEEDPSPLTVIAINTARKLAWKNKRILKT